MVRDDFPIPYDGIIGLDFIRKYNCVLEYRNEGVGDVLHIRPEELSCELTVKILDGAEAKVLSLPARSEVVRKIFVDSHIVGDILIPNQTLADGVFVANTITSKTNPYVRIVNTKTTNIFITNAAVKIESLSNYNILRSTIIVQTGTKKF